MVEKKIKKGMKLTVVFTGYTHREEPRVSEETVAKVGSKYFYLEGHMSRLKFEMETMHELVEAGSAHYYCYFSMQEYEDKKEHARLSDKVRMYFSGYARTKLTLDQFRRIDAILEEKQ